MELISRKMPKSYEIIDTGDWHIGPLNCNINGIEEMLGYVADGEHRYISIKGDMIDAVAPNDKRYAHCAMASMDLLTAQQQADKVIKLLMPIKDRVLAIGIGNHEYKMINTVNFAKYIADELGVPYGAYTFKFIHLDSKGRPRWKGLLTHGYGNFNSRAKDTIQRLANDKASLKRKLEATGHTDCVYMSMGHTHKLILVEPTIGEEVMLTDDGERITQSYRVHSDQSASYIPSDGRFYANTGSFLNLYSPPGSEAIGYGEVAMYGPVEHGYIKITVDNHEVAMVEKTII